MTPLIFAAIGGHTDTVRFLVHAGAALDAQNKVTVYFFLCSIGSNLAVQ